MLEIKSLQVKIDEHKKVLENIDLFFHMWKNYALLWKNGSWKSSLALTVMWNPKYQIVWWDILLDWESIKGLSADQRAKKGIFLAFQNIPEVPWVKLFDFLKAVYNANIHQWDKPVSFLQFKKLIQPYLDELDIPKDFLFRELNVGFSWWEKRKIEMLQLKLLNPKYIILDEVDSWLDINAIKSLGDMLKKIDNENNCIIIISHNFAIYDFIDVDQIVVLEDWGIKQVWKKSLLGELAKQWF